MAQPIARPSWDDEFSWCDGREDALASPSLLTRRDLIRGLTCRRVDDGEHRRRPALCIVENREPTNLATTPEPADVATDRVDERTKALVHGLVVAAGGVTGALATIPYIASQLSDAGDALLLKHSALRGPSNVMAVIVIGATVGYLAYRRTEIRRRLVIVLVLAILLAFGYAVATTSTDPTPAMSVAQLPDQAAPPPERRISPLRVDKPVVVGMKPVALARGRGALWVIRQKEGVTRLTPGAPGLSPADVAVGGRHNDAAVLRHRLYLTTGRGTVRAIDTRTERPAGRSIDYGDDGGPIVAGFGDLWVGSTSYSKVVRIDPVTGHQNPVPIPAAANALAVGFGSVWASVDDHWVIRIDAQSHSTTQIRVGDGPSRLSVSETGVWVLHPRNHTVTRIDPDTNRETGPTLHVGTVPTDLTVAAGRVWVLSAGDEELRGFDAQTGRQTAHVPVGGYPTSITRWGRRQLFVATEAGGTVIRVRLARALARSPGCRERNAGAHGPRSRPSVRNPLLPAQPTLGFPIC